MIVLEGGYAIEQYPRENRIVISLPQRFDTATSSAPETRERRYKLDEKELAAIAYLTKTYYEMYNHIPYTVKEDTSNESSMLNLQESSSDRS